MKLYLLERTDGYDYDEYIALVVAAPSPSVAKMTPVPYFDKPLTKPEFIKVTYIGVAKRGLKQGVVLDSYNAG